MLVHCFICLSARVEFKFKFEFNSLSEAQKLEIEIGKERNPKSNPGNPAPQLAGPTRTPLSLFSPRPTLPCSAQLAPAPVEAQIPPAQQRPSLLFPSSHAAPPDSRPRGPPQTALAASLADALAPRVRPFSPAVTPARAAPLHSVATRCPMGHPNVTP